MIFDAVPTEAQMLEGMSTREQEMRYVTQHFKDLQGLKASPIVAGLLLFLHLAPRGPKHWELNLLIAGGLLLFAILWSRKVSRWYRERYGLVVTATKNPPEMLPGYLGAAWLIYAITICCIISLRVSFIPINVLYITKTFFLPNCFFAAPTGFAIQLRRMLYVAGVIAVLGLVLYLTFTHVQSFIAVYTSLWAFLLLSLLDHWLLTYLLRPSGMDGSGALHD